MSNITTTQAVDPVVLEALLSQGDCSRLNPQQKVALINELCVQAGGLNPLLKPFDFMKTKDGKLIPYSNKGCAEQLRNIRHISLRIVAREKIEDVYIVTAEAQGKDGRVDSATGVVSIGGLKGEMLANAMMKAETKAKRRVTLSICGMNMLDETEVETIPGAVRENFDPQSVAKDVTPAKEPKPGVPKNEGPISEAQIKRMFAIMNKKAINQDALKDVVKKLYKKESSKDLKRWEYDELTQNMESLSRDDFFTWFAEQTEFL